MARTKKVNQEVIENKGNGYQINIDELTNVLGEINNQVTDTIEKPYTTKHLAEKLGITPKMLRRQLRAMEKYNDGTYTHYRWNSMELDAMVKKLTKQAKAN